MVDITICGLFETELIAKGIMKKGRCRDCFHYDNDGFHMICTKTDKTIDEEMQDCPQWVIDTR